MRWIFLLGLLKCYTYQKNVGIILETRSLSMSHTKSWSILTLKSIDDESRIIKGIASTPSTDRAGDIVEPKGAKFTLPFPLLAQHDHSSPIGEVISAQVTDKGIEIEARVAMNSGLDYVEKTWKQIKSGLVRGLSIGFRGLEVEPTKNKKGLRFKSYEIIELSAVTIPCNADASIYAIKKLDESPDADVSQLKFEHEMRLHDAKIKAAASISKAVLSLTK
jgi:HK97 family phage prohead protease